MLLVVIKCFNVPGSASQMLQLGWSQNIVIPPLGLASAGPVHEVAIIEEHSQTCSSFGRCFQIQWDSTCSCATL